MPHSTLNSLGGCFRSTAIAAWCSISVKADDKCLCCPVIGSALGKCQFVVDNTDNGVHLHNAIFLNHKEVGNNAKSSHRKGSSFQVKKRRQGEAISYDITSRGNLKMDTNELLSQRETTSDFGKKLLITKKE